MHYAIKKWKGFQHYKDRNPPWIKLHRELLTSETWVSLDDASRVLAIACMLVAAATDNKIPSNPSHIKRVAYLNSDPNFDALVQTGFIDLIDDNGEIASTTLATRKHLVQIVRPETETEKEKALSAKPTYPLGFQEFWKSYPNTLRKGGRPDAYEMWKAKKLEPQSAIIVAHVIALKNSNEWRDSQYIPAPKVYLKRQQWDGATVGEPEQKRMVV